MMAEWRIVVIREVGPAQAVEVEVARGLVEMRGDERPYGRVFAEVVLAVEVEHTTTGGYQSGGKIGVAHPDNLGWRSGSGNH